MIENSQREISQNKIIPLKGLSSNIKQHDGIMKIQQPIIDFKQRLANIRNFGIDMPISVTQFTEQAKIMMRDVAAMTGSKDYINSPCLPIVLPQIADDHVVAVIKSLLLALKNSLKMKGLVFDNRLDGRLDRLLSMDDSDPYWDVINKMRSETQVLLYFPLPRSLQGCSIDGQRKIIHKLPDGFIGSSLLDAAMAMLMYSDILVPASISAGYCCPAMSWFLSESAPYFRCVGGILFLDHVDTSVVYDDYCGGIIYTGKLLK